MPIYGMTKSTDDDAFLPKRPNVLGKIALGMPKPEKGPGKNLNEKMRFHSDTGWVSSAFQEIYGGLIVDSINIYFFYPTHEQTWDCGREERGDAGRLIRRCNRLWIEKELVMNQGLDKYNKPKTNYGHKTFKPGEKPCLVPYDPENPSLDCQHCSHVGRLSFYIREFYDRGIQGMFTLENHSKNNIPLLAQHLAQKEEELRAIGGDLCSSPVISPATQGLVPWVLRRYQKSIIKNIGGKSTRSLEWLVTVDINEQWLQEMKQQQLRQALALPSAPVQTERQLPMPPVEPFYAIKQRGTLPTIEELKQEISENSVDDIPLQTAVVEIVPEPDPDLQQRKDLNKRVIKILKDLSSRPESDMEKAKEFAKGLLQAEFEQDSIEFLSLEEYFEYVDKLECIAAEIQD